MSGFSQEAWVPAGIPLHSSVFVRVTCQPGKPGKVKEFEMAEA